MDDIKDTLTAPFKWAAGTPDEKTVILNFMKEGHDYGPNGADYDQASIIRRELMGFEYADWKTIPRLFAYRRYPTTLSPGNAESPDVHTAINAVRTHLKQHGGPLDQLVIYGHGSVGGKDRDIKIGEHFPVSLEDFIFELSSLRDEFGDQIAKRLVFASCELFKNLTPDEMETYLEFARDMKMDIVGSSYSISVSNKYDDMAGSFIKFTSDGQILKDELTDEELGLYRLTAEFNGDAPLITDDADPGMSSAENNIAAQARAIIDIPRTVPPEGSVRKKIEPSIGKPIEP